MDEVSIIKDFLAREKKEKLIRYQRLNQFVKKNQILFTGSSLMEQFPIHELCLDYGVSDIIYNRGIGGYVTEEFMEAMDTLVFDLEPSKIFINIGTNDLNDLDYTVQTLVDTYEKILKQIKNRLPNAKIYIMAYYPVNGSYDFGNPFMKEILQIRTNDRIAEANEAIKTMADILNIEYIDINKNLKDSEGNLKAEFSIEGMHMYGNGYQAIFEDLMKYIQVKPD